MCFVRCGLCGTCDGSSEDHRWKRRLFEGLGAKLRGLDFMVKSGVEKNNIT